MLGAKRLRPGQAGDRGQEDHHWIWSSKVRVLPPAPPSGRAAVRHRVSRLSETPDIGLPGTRTPGSPPPVGAKRLVVR
jgi:hypothetical protein